MNSLCLDAKTLDLIVCPDLRVAAIGKPSSWARLVCLINDCETKSLLLPGLGPPISSLLSETDV